MQTTQYSLTINNEKLWKFYKDHPNIDFETTNLLFMDVLEKFLQDANTSLTANIASELVDQIKKLQSQIGLMADNHLRVQTETALNFNYKLSEFKKDYIEEVKVI
jgi:hypothetical protein